MEKKKYQDRNPPAKVEVVFNPHLEKYLYFGHPQFTRKNVSATRSTPRAPTFTTYLTRLT